MSSTRNEKWEKMPYAALKQILLGIAATPKDAAIVFGTVCSRWRDVAINHSNDLWKHFYFTRFVLKPEEGSASTTKLKPAYERHTFHEFEQRAEADVSAKMLRQRSHASLYNRQVPEIEGCTLEVAFSCPVMSQNLRLLQGEVDEETKLPIYFCDICKANVYTITDESQLQRYAGKNRCVQMSAAKYSSFCSGDVVQQARTNVCFLVPTSSSNSSTVETPQHLLTSRQLKQLDATGMARVFGREVLRLANHWVATHHDDLHFVAGATNEARAQMYANPGEFTFQLVEVDPDQSLSDWVKPNEGPLCNAKAPTAGGWSFIVAFPPLDKQLLNSSTEQIEEETKTIIGTQLHALMKNKRVVSITEFAAYSSPTAAEMMQRKDGLRFLAEDVGQQLWTFLKEKMFVEEPIVRRNVRGRMAPPRPTVALGQGPLPKDAKMAEGDKEQKKGDSSNCAIA